LDTGYSKINGLYRSFSTSSIQEDAVKKATEETESLLTFKKPTE
jgi:hypothetical protein